MLTGSVAELSGFRIYRKSYFAELRKSDPGERARRTWACWRGGKAPRLALAAVHRPSPCVLCRPPTSEVSSTLLCHPEPAGRRISAQPRSCSDLATQPDPAPPRNPPGYPERSRGISASPAAGVRGCPWASGAGRVPQEWGRTRLGWWASVGSRLSRDPSTCGLMTSRTGFLGDEDLRLRSGRHGREGTRGDTRECARGSTACGAVAAICRRVIPAGVAPPRQYQRFPRSARQPRARSRCRPCPAATP